MRPIRKLDIPALIPAYQPEPSLLTLVRTLQELGFRTIIIVNDGSGADRAAIFEQLSGVAGVHVLRHAVNRGKGAALKTGLRHVLENIPECAGVVTADADGQHHPEDILRVAARLERDSSALVLGVRTFDKNVPWRNRMGNVLTRKLIRWIVGTRVTDSQTGLRGVPRALIPSLLELPSQGYEFELEMLIACKHQSFRIAEEPIRTIYLEGNRSSHFNHVSDSIRIYRVLFRFSFLFTLAAALDLIVFATAFTAGASIPGAHLLSRFVAAVFNGASGRSAARHSQQRRRAVFSKFAGLAVASSLVSYALLMFIHKAFEVSVIPAKLMAEGLLFIAGFMAQRDFVFTRRKGPALSKKIAALSRISRLFQVVVSAANRAP
jgi:glycosyltransferase involved in cell wall biosynthesis